jgi:superfamily II DNA or RNA helicase
MGQADETMGLTDLIGPAVFELTIQDLAGTFLADLDLITVSVDLSPGERRRYDEHMARFRLVFGQFHALAPGANWADFLTAAGQTPEGRQGVEAWRSARQLLAYNSGKAAAVAALLRRHREARVLVFTADNETAYAIARTHLIMPITCDIGRAERADALRRFRDGQLRALVSARVLNEGLDVPAADVAIVVGGTQGQREHVQRVGRILRPAPGKRALVYELVVRHTGEVARARERRQGLVPRQAAAVHV